MKRLVWLALFAFGTLLTQVTPMEPLSMKAHDQGCGGDSCGHTNKGKDDCTMCAACFQGGALAVLAAAGSVDFSPLPAIRLESPAAFGRQLNYPPPLPPPRAA